MGFFAFIFTFLLGAVVALLAAAYSIYYVLIVVEKKTDSQRQKLAKAVSPEESQRAVQLLIPELKTKVRFSFTPAPWPKDAAKRMQQTAIVLKANMFFHFLDEKRDACNIARLDNCAIELIRHEGKAKFNKKSYIKIASPGGSLFPDAAAPSGSTAGKSTADTCYIKFFNGKDLEQWYYALKSATSLTVTREVKQVEMMQAQQRYFAHLTAVANNSAEVNADWANALLGRVFWSIHNHPVFLNLITEKLQKKIAKLKRPKFVESISVTDVGFGPNLPLFSNIKIISVTPQGALAFDGDVYYHGGFNLMIDINLRIDLPIGNVSVEVPIRASVVVKTFAGRGHIQVAPPPAKRAWIGFYGEPRVDMDIKIEVGKNLSLVNIPSLANIVINKIKQQLIKKLVLPAMDDWPLPHIPAKKVPETAAVAADSGTSETDSAHPSALLSSRAGAGITSTQLSQTSAASSPAQSRQSERPASFSSSSTAPLSVSSSAVTTKRHSVAVLPGGHASTGSVGTASAAGAKAQPTITVKTRASPAERVRNDHSQPSGASLGPPPLPVRTHSAPSKIVPPESPLLESEASGYKPLMALAGATGANANLSSLQVPSAPPRGQWNSTDEWYQNSLLALRDRDDSDGSDGSDNEDPSKQQARQLDEERERQAKENKEKEERERKVQEDKEKERSKQEQEERERAERERIVQEEKEQKEREDQERRDLEATNKVETPVEPLSSTPVVRKSLSERQNSDDAREIEQFTPLDKPETSRRETVTVDDESKARQEREREEAEQRMKRDDEAREQREREEKERKEREEEEEREKQRRLAEEQERAEKKRKEEQEEKERKEKERKAAEEAEKQAKERELRSGGLQSTRLEAFTDPLSSSLNNPLFDEIFGTTTDDSDDEPPRRQSTFDGVMASAPLLPDAPHRRRSGSLNVTPSLPPTPAPAPASAPALPPRAHEQQVSTVTSGSASTKPMSAPTPTPAGGSSKGRTTSHMFEDFDFSFPSAAPSSSSTSSPRTPSSPSPVASFLGLATPALPASPPRASAPTPSSAANTTDNLFSFSTTTSSSSSSSSISSSSSAAKPGAKKGLFNLDMEDIFNKVEKQHHLVEKFKAAKTRAQNAIHDWNTPHGPGGGGSGGGDSGQEL